MSDSKQGGGEPSMEEILASIRKIISEDTADGGEQAARTGGDTGDPGDSAGATGRGVDDGVLELSDSPSGDDAAGADDAPLDLTEEVPSSDGNGGDGDEVPLELDEPVDGDTAAPPEGAADPAVDRQAASEDIGAYEDAAPAATPEDPSRMAAAGDDESGFLADPFDDTASGGQAPDTAAEAALAAGAMAAGGAGAKAGRDASADASADASDDTATPLGPEDQRVISETAERQAVEQLSTLAQQAEAEPGNSAAQDVDHILARMVRDALRPQLREWMDRNLPQIVERIVREEVQRMTRRAQGLDDDTRY